ncbi:hypothetical protein [Pelovirga terrestris]|nr:hypothetical protein [Pelovirga terrestris]
MKTAFGEMIVLLMVFTASLAAEDVVGFIRTVTAVVWDGLW